ncbi:hypothetical protein ABER02_16650 [Rossellomorea marisflavi]|uniref:hypothetical protein n=1 Tax=Rossellomorea marisflavi TaxID=189381 RepID=UPI003D295730
MSTVDRKIGFYNFIYRRHITSEEYFDKQHFLNFMRDLESLDYIMDVNKIHKAISIEWMNISQINYQDVIELVFKSCKYNHSPDYMSSVDGSVRPSSKELFEGEKELTHLCIKVTSVEAEVILEERRSGVTINEIIKYFKKCMREYNTNNQIPKNFSLEYGIVPSDDFITSLNGMTRVKVAEIYKHKRILGSEALNLLNREDLSMKEDIMITMKAKKGESLGKTFIKRAYQIIGEDVETKRIRVYGNDEENKGIKLDSEMMKRLDFIKAELHQNGVVNSHSIFDKMIEILGVNINGDE